MNHKYGACHACGGEVEERLAEHSVHEGTDWVVIRSVPTGVCIQCGERVFRWQVMERIEEIVLHRRQRTPDTRIDVPVFGF